LKINLRKKEDLIGLAKDLLKMEDVKEIESVGALVPKAMV